MKWLSKLFGWMRVLVSDETLDTVDKVARAAIPIVHQIAALTPTRADDIIVGVCQRYGLDALEWYRTIPEANRGIVLADIAARILSKRFPSTATHVLRLGIEAAVASYRKEAASV